MRLDEFVSYYVPVIRRQYPGTLVYGHYVRIISNQNKAKCIDYYPEAQTAIFKVGRKPVKTKEMNAGLLLNHLGI